MLRQLRLSKHLAIQEQDGRQTEGGFTTLLSLFTTHHAWAPKSSKTLFLVSKFHVFLVGIATFVFSIGIWCHWYKLKTISKSKDSWKKNLNLTSHFDFPPSTLAQDHPQQNCHFISSTGFLWVFYSFPRRFLWVFYGFSIGFLEFLPFCTALSPSAGVRSFALAAPGTWAMSSAGRASATARTNGTV